MEKQWTTYPRAVETNQIHRDTEYSMYNWGGRWCTVNSSVSWNLNVIKRKRPEQMCFHLLRWDAVNSTLKQVSSDFSSFFSFLILPRDTHIKVIEELTSIHSIDWRTCDSWSRLLRMHTCGLWEDEKSVTDTVSLILLWRSSCPLPIQSSLLINGQGREGGSITSISDAF